MEDDFGRTPLHDACWRAEPAFEIVTLLLRNHTDLIRRGDVRGALPLDYVRREHWLHWIAFLLIKADQYWPLPSVVTIPSCIDSESISTISDNSAGDSIGTCSDATVQETGDEQATASAKRLRSLN